MVLVFGIAWFKSARAQMNLTDRYQVAVNTLLGTEKARKSIRLNHDAFIPRDSVVQNPIVVTRARLEVAGQVNNDIVALDGDVVLDSSAVVTGNVTAINGWVTIQPGARVAGIIRETNWETFKAEDDEAEYEEWQFFYPFDDFHRGKSQNHLMFRYNRAEGVFLGIKRNKSRVLYRKVNLFGHLGYGFASKSWRFLLGIQRQFPISKETDLNLGIQGYDRTDFRDTWRLSVPENTLTALFIHEDYLYYFRTSGFAISSALNSGTWLHLQGEYAEERYATMPVRTDWAVFGKNKHFPPALELGEFARFYRLWRIQGQLQFAVFGWQGDSLPRFKMQFWWEHAPRQWVGGWQYQRAEVEVQTNLALSTVDRLRIRLRGGSASGSLPIQRKFLLGGFSTLRGFPFNAFQGNRYILANMEYQLSNQIVEDLLFGLDTDFVIFLDSGAAWNVGERIPVWQLKPEQGRMQTNVGIGIGDVRDGIRINFARAVRPQGEINRWYITVRISKAF